MLRSLIGIFLICSFTSCVRSVATKAEFAGTIGKQHKIQREALLFKLGPYSERHHSETHHLYDRRADGNAWRKKGWVQPGTPLRITGIRKYLTDTRGSWIGATGIIEDPVSGADVEFLYCWSFGNQLKRAPWEDQSVPELRETSQLK